MSPTRSVNDGDPSGYLNPIYDICTNQTGNVDNKFFDYS